MKKPQPGHHVLTPSISPSGLSWLHIMTNGLAFKRHHNSMVSIFYPGLHFQFHHRLHSEPTPLTPKRLNFKSTHF